MSNRYGVPVLVCGLLLLGVSPGGAGSTADGGPLAAMLPGGAEIVVYVPSLAGFDAAAAEISAALDRPAFRHGDLFVQLMDGRAGTLFEHADASGPLAVAIELPDMATGRPQVVTAVFRTALSSDGLAERVDTLAAATPYAYAIGDKGFVAVSTAPDRAPGSGLPALFMRMPEDNLSVRLDLAAILDAYGPMMELGLAAIPVSDRPGDDTSAVGDPTDPRFTSGQVAGLRKILRGLVDAAVRFDMSFDVVGPELVVTSDLIVAAGSPLEAAPGRDISRALDLSRRLPPGATFTYVGAGDFSGLLDLASDYYRESLMASAETSGAGEALAAEWFDTYLEVIALLFEPYAANIAFSDESWTYVAVLESDDAAATAAWLAGRLDALPAEVLGLDLERQPARSISGVEVHGWDVAVSDADGAGLLFGGMSGEPGRTTGPYRPADLLAHMPSTLRIGHRDGLLFCSIGGSTEDFAALLEADGRAPDERLASMARCGGDDSLSLIVGDLAPYLAWIASLLPEAGSASVRDAVPAGPIGVRSLVTAGGTCYGSRSVVALDGLKALGSFIGTLGAPVAGSE